MVTPPTEVFFPGSQIMIECGDSSLYGDIKEGIHEFIQGPNLIKYMLNKNSWTQDIFESIDWNPMKIFMNSITSLQVTNVVKLVHHWQNDGHQKIQHSTV